MIPIFPNEIMNIQQFDDNEYRLIYPEVERYLDQLDNDMVTMFTQEEIEDMADEIYENLRDNLPRIQNNKSEDMEETDISQRRNRIPYNPYGRRVIRGRRYYRNLIIQLLLRRLLRRGYYGGRYMPY